MRLNLFFISLFFLTLSLFSQTTSEKDKKWTDDEQKQLEKAQLFFSEKNYRLALPIFEKLILNHSSDVGLKYQYGVCALSRPGLQKIALENLQSVFAKNKKAFEIEYFLAKANFLNGNFEEAIKLATAHQSKMSKATEEDKKEVELFLNYCSNAKQLSSKPLNVKIENMGSVINSSAAESSPCLTDDENVIIFTYRGEKSIGGLQNAFNQPDKNGLYYEDVFTSVKEKGIWQNPAGINNVNSNNNEAVMFLSIDGQNLFTSKDSQQDDGDIYVSKNENNSWSVPEKLLGDINTSAWEDNSSLSPDGKTLFFSSTRPGGLGGKDIYKASLMPDGSWGNVKNLGNKINTPLDDDSPFLHYDGRLLLFSSKGHNSMGGYDIFKTYLNLKDSSWSEPENIGYPINTPGDDNHYVLSPSGETGYYALGKPDGFGDLDIYTVEPGITGVMPLVAVVKGSVSFDNAPAQADIVVEIPSKNSIFRTVKSNDITGNYRITLPVGEDYKITWKLNDLPPKTETILAATAQEHLMKIVDVNFSSKKDSILASADSLKGKTDLGNQVIEGLVYRIQVSSESIARKLKNKIEKDFGSVEKETVNGIAKFYIKQDYKTLKEVTDAVEKVRSTLVPDAFVLGFNKGKRYHLFELRKQGILPVKKPSETFTR